MVIVKVLLGPIHVPILGVIVMLPLMEEDVALAAEKTGILLLPLATNPIAVLLFVQV